jgi:hypothetical protein
MMALATTGSLAHLSSKLHKQSFNYSPGQTVGETSKDQLQDALALALLACHGAENRYQPPQQKPQPAQTSRASEHCRVAHAKASQLHKANSPRTEIAAKAHLQ